MKLNPAGMVMGILNVTPDSFSDGGLNTCREKAVERALEMEKQGAMIIDIGGESTRPKALKVSVETELERTIEVIQSLRACSDVFISIDTSKAKVAELAIEAGADIVNDVTGLRGDPRMIEVCADTEVAVVVMHMQGKPENMQNAPKYDDVVVQIKTFFEQRLVDLTSAGIDPQRICFDPGIGFGKALEHNKELLRRIPELKVGEHPLLLGVSRKSIIGSLLDRENPLDRDWGTIALTSYGRLKGAEIHRVHEVKKCVESMRMVEAILSV